LAHGLALMGFVELAVGLLIGGEATPSEYLLLRATLVLVLAVQLQPRQTAPGPVAIRASLLWSILCGVVLLAGHELSVGGALRSLPVVLVAAGTGLLVYLFSGAAQLLSQRLHDRRRASRICLLVLLLSVSLPLWAAPLATFGSATVLVDAIIALCPVSYLATLADIDYLRGAWPYQYLPYGGLRYNYADPALMTMALLAGAALITAPGVFRSRFTADSPFSVPTIFSEMKP
jgi:uncharacterized membrane protein YhaH (DUF805 family)